jgi:hypothetical protein
MNERPEQDDFDEDEEQLEPGDDVDSAMREFDHVRRRPTKAAGDPAWRRLERLRDERRTAELTSDFEDYDIGRGPAAFSGSPATAPATRPKKPSGR